MSLRHAFLFLLCFGFAAPVQAQSMANDTLPIEVMLLHNKLLGRTPDYMTIIYKNPEFSRIRDREGQDAMIQQQRLLLERLYNNAGKNTPVFVHKDMVATGLVIRSRQIGFAPLTPDEPFIFRADDNNIYAIFVRNGSVLERLAAPFEFDDFISLDREFNVERKNMRLQLALLPIAADDKPFALASGESVRVILADISEIKIESKSNKKLLLYKKLNDDGGLPIPIPSGPPAPHADFAPLPPPAPPAR